MEAAPQKRTTQSQTEETKGDEKDISVVYCIDISGSMNGMRLECVKSTILTQIEEMHNKYP